MFRAVVLAAGKSSRMGRENKLLLPFGGGTIIEQVITELKKVDRMEIIVVSGDRQVREIAGRLGVETVSPAGAICQSNSLKAGLLGLTDKITGIFFVLGDQPFIQADLYLQMQQVFGYLQKIGSSRDIILPYYGNKRGNPVLIGTGHGENLTRIKGDQGAREIIAGNRHRIFKLVVDNPGLIMDIDTPEEYKLALKSLT